MLFRSMMAPFPRSFQEILHRAAVDEILASFWNESQGFPSDLPESLTTKELPGCLPSPSTYGEVTTTGARQIFDHMELYGRSKAATFMDLGSGMGKLVTHGSMELQCLELAVGIELDPHRHSTATSNLKNSRKRRKDADFGSAAPVHLHRGDILDASVSTATHVYVSSLCFTKKMMQDLGTKLQNEAVNLKCVATLQPFPEAEQVHYPSRTLALTKTEYVEMSWTKPFGCPVFFYRLHTADRQQPLDIQPSRTCCQRCSRRVDDARLLTSEHPPPVCLPTS